jgi:hypothetical protein
MAAGPAPRPGPGATAGLELLSQLRKLDDFARACYPESGELAHRLARCRNLATQLTAAGLFRPRA